MRAFDYPAAPRARLHGPRGYKDYESYRPWLRDEFAFRCGYCLAREKWGRVKGEYDLDHFVPQRTDPARKAEYGNLVYACRRCNSAKSGASVPDPMGMTAQHLRVQPDGTLQPFSADAEALVLKLDLNGPRMVEWRLLWMRLMGELVGEYPVHDPGASIVCIACLLMCAPVVSGWIKPAAILSFLDERLLEEYTRSMERANAGRPFPPLPPVQGATDDMSAARPMDHPLWDQWLNG